MHRGGGEVVVQIGADPQAESFRLRYRRRRRMSYVHHSLDRKKGAFFAELTRDGFIRNGAIALNGCSKMPSPEAKEYPVFFQTVLQTDGDMVCKIDCNLLYHEDTEALLQSYTTIRAAFMQDLRGPLERSLSRMLLSVSLSLSALGVLHYLWSDWDQILFLLGNFLQLLKNIP